MENLTFLRLITAFVMLLGGLSDTLSAQLIQWSPDRDIQWSEFKGEADRNSSRAASSNCRIDYTFKFTSKSLTTEVKCFFDPSRSWVHSRNSSENLRIHEMGHFDICEIYGRKLRKAFEDYGKKMNVQTVQKDLEVIFNRLWAEYREKQEQYDRETRHGMNPEAQQNWLDKIAADLKKSEAYSLFPATEETTLKSEDSLKVIPEIGED